MATTTLTVPAEHVEVWRDAVLVELRSDAEWLAGNVENAQRKVLADRARIEDAELRKVETEPAHLLDVEDVVTPSVEIQRDCEILRGSFEATDGPLEVTGATQTLGHICETMASKVLPPMISDVTCTTPYSGEVAKEITDVIGTLDWATSEATRLHAVWAEQFQAEKAAKA